jgi:hypothetical protein
LALAPSVPVIETGFPEDDWNRVLLPESFTWFSSRQICPFGAQQFFAESLLHSIYLSLSSSFREIAPFGIKMGSEAAHDNPITTYLDLMLFIELYDVQYVWFRGISPWCLSTFFIL